MSGEIWKALPGAEGSIEVSDLGRVRTRRSFKTRTGRMLDDFRVLDPYVASGYGHLAVRCVGIHANRKFDLVHRLVLRAFVGEPPPGKSHARHLNGNPIDNRLTNLSWGSPGENGADRRRHNIETPNRRGGQGERCSLARLTQPQVEQVWVRRDDRPSEIARGDFGVDESTIRAILDGKTWRHVTGLAQRTKGDRRVRGTAHEKAKLTEEMVIESRKLRAEGMTYTALGARYGVSRAAIRNVVTGRAWGHIPGALDLDG